MKKFLLALILLSIVSGAAFAQSTSCAQTLRLAKSTFESGRLHELPGLLEKCLVNGFNTTEKVDAYKLLIQAYIYLEEPEKADQAMLSLLQISHYFEINEAVDPAEFVALYKTFRTKPIFKIGFKVGANMTFPSVRNNYYVGNTADGTGTYGRKIGFQGALTFEKDLFLASQNKFLNKLTIAPEVQYILRNLSYAGSSVFVDDELGTSVATTEITYKQAWIDLNVLMQYRLPFSFNPYVGIGPGASYLMSASNQYKFSPVNGSGVSGSAVDVKDSYRSLLCTVIGVAGVKFKAGALLVQLEGRLQYGLMNVVNPKKRTNVEATYDYASQFNDFTQSNAAINVGVIYPVFSPKKQ